MQVCVVVLVPDPDQSAREPGHGEDLLLLVHRQGQRHPRHPGQVSLFNIHSGHIKVLIGLSLTQPL